MCLSGQNKANQNIGITQCTYSGSVRVGLATWSHSGVGSKHLKTRQNKNPLEKDKSSSELKIDSSKSTICQLIYIDHSLK